VPNPPPPRDNGMETQLYQWDDDRVIICWLILLPLFREWWGLDKTDPNLIIDQSPKQGLDLSFPCFRMASISWLDSNCLGCDSAQPIHTCAVTAPESCCHEQGFLNMVIAPKAASVTMDQGKQEERRASSSNPTQWNKDSQCIDDSWKILVGFGISKLLQLASWVVTPSSISSGGHYPDIHSLNWSPCACWIILFSN